MDGLLTEQQEFFKKQELSKMHRLKRSEISETCKTHLHAREAEKKPFYLFIFFSGLIYPETKRFPPREGPASIESGSCFCSSIILILPTPHILPGLRSTVKPKHVADRIRELAYVWRHV